MRGGGYEKVRYIYLPGDVPVGSLVAVAVADWTSLSVGWASDLYQT